METGSLGTKDIWAIEPVLEGEDMFCETVGGEFVGNGAPLKTTLSGSEEKRTRDL